MPKINPTIQGERRHNDHHRNNYGKGVDRRGPSIMNHGDRRKYNPLNRSNMPNNNNQQRNNYNNNNNNRGYQRHKDRRGNRDHRRAPPPRRHDMNYSPSSTPGHTYNRHPSPSSNLSRGHPSSINTPTNHHHHKKSMPSPLSPSTPSNPRRSTTPLQQSPRRKSVSPASPIRRHPHFDTPPPATTTTTTTTQSQTQQQQQKGSPRKTLNQKKKKSLKDRIDKKLFVNTTDHSQSLPNYGPSLPTFDELKKSQQQLSKFIKKLEKDLIELEANEPKEPTLESLSDNMVDENLQSIPPMLKIYYNNQKNAEFANHRFDDIIHDINNCVEIHHQQQEAIKSKNVYMSTWGNHTLKKWKKMEENDGAKRAVIESGQTQAEFFRERERKKLVEYASHNFSCLPTPKMVRNDEPIIDDAFFKEVHEIHQQNHEAIASKMEQYIRHRVKKQTRRLHDLQQRYYKAQKSWVKEHNVRKRDMKYHRKKEAPETSLRMVTKEDAQYPFISENGYTFDPAEEYRLNGSKRAFLAQWTPSEEQIFHEQYVKAPKQFHAISEHLPNKTVGDLINYYYFFKEDRLKDSIKEGKELIAKQLEQYHLDAAIPHYMGARTTQEKKVMPVIKQPKPLEDWSEEERATFHRLHGVYGSNVRKISKQKQMKNKTIAQLKEYYGRFYGPRATETYEPPKDLEKPVMEDDELKPMVTKAKKVVNEHVEEVVETKKNKRLVKWWVRPEREALLKNLPIYGKDWDKLAEIIGSKTPHQVHRQYKSLLKELDLTKIRQEIKPSSSKKKKKKKDANKMTDDIEYDSHNLMVLSVIAQYKQNIDQHTDPLLCGRDEKKPYEKYSKFVKHQANLIRQYILGNQQPRKLPKTALDILVEKCLEDKEEAEKARAEEAYHVPVMAHPHHPHMHHPHMDPMAHPMAHQHPMHPQPVYYNHPVYPNTQSVSSYPIQYSHPYFNYYNMQPQNYSQPPPPPPPAAHPGQQVYYYPPRYYQAEPMPPHD